MCLIWYCSKNWDNLEDWYAGALSVFNSIGMPIIAKQNSKWVITESAFSELKAVAHWKWE